MKVTPKFEKSSLKFSWQSWKHTSVGFSLTSAFASKPTAKRNPSCPISSITSSVLQMVVFSVELKKGVNDFAILLNQNHAQLRQGLFSPFESISFREVTNIFLR